MPATEDLYVLAPGEGEEGTDGWVSPKPIDEAVEAAVTDATDLQAEDLDDVESYVDLEAVAALLDGDGEGESLTFDVEGHDVVIDGGGHIEVDPA